MWYIIIYENKQKVRLLNMPAPRLNIPEYELTENDRMSNVMRQLYKIGYDVEDAKTAIWVIEKFHIDKSQFDFPYDSFEEAKKHVLAGEFDYRKKSFSSGKEKIEALHKAVKEGKLWVTY